MKPLSGLPARWLSESYDGTREFRLAASLASIHGRFKGDKFKDEKGNTRVYYMRNHMEGVNKYLNGFEKEASDVVWREGDVVDSMIEVLLRRAMLFEGFGEEGRAVYGDKAKVYALPEDIAYFIEGRTDMNRLHELLWGLILIDWKNYNAQEVPWNTGMPLKSAIYPDAAYGIIKLCFPGVPGREVMEEMGAEVPVVPAIIRKAEAGDSRGAMEMACRRLRGSGLAPAVYPVAVSRELSRRIAASVLFPLSDTHIRGIMGRVLRPDSGGKVIVAGRGGEDKPYEE